MAEKENALAGLRHLTTNFESIPITGNKFVQDLPRPHLDSFNYVLVEGLNCAVQDISPVEFKLPNESKIGLFFKEASVAKPTSDPSALYKVDTRVFPSECRRGGSSYRGKLNIQMCCLVDGKSLGTIERTVGEIPIMVKSMGCHLHQMSPAELVRHHEEAEDFGGYFIVNGIEKILRMLILPRRNYPLAMARSSWSKRGKSFSEYGVTIRCVRRDQSAANMVLHYLTNGTAKLMFAYQKEMFFIPIVLMLKALFGATDREIYVEIMQGKEDMGFCSEFVFTMLRQVQDEGLYNQNDVLEYIGRHFREKLRSPEWYSNREVAEFLIKECICIHLEANRDKFNLLIFMTRKLLSAVHGKCALESPDNPMNHEVLLGGHMYLMLLKEKLHSWLHSLKFAIEKKAKTVGRTYVLDSKNLMAAFKGVGDLTRPMEYLLTTGTLSSRTGLALMQNQGLSVIADRLNYLRYVSHFRCIHRGSYFAAMRTTTARKLLPESWGFICPVHTPDGTPCGLLNHLTSSCVVVTRSYNVNLAQKLCSMGMTTWDIPPSVPCSECYEVILDGKLIGRIAMKKASNIVSQLRVMKTESLVPTFLEICLIPNTGKPSQYPGLFLYTTPARMMRPVLNLATKTVEYIGIMEQVYLDICVTTKEYYPKNTTHMELKEANMLSFLANLIPMSDHNQSPRNMYQCQMSKQTMGTPAHALRCRTDNKLYRLMTPQSPLFRTKAYDKYDIDNYPLGTNAIVAVISYTGYDMEDAMVINKSSYERGFAHAVVYKSEFVDLLKGKRAPTHYFGREPGNSFLDGKLDMDGFAPVGTFLSFGDPLYSTIEASTGVARIVKYHSNESAYLEEVMLCSSGNIDSQKACFRYRMPRNPNIGDKFASRHGQKGICSLKWPQVDMPFTESGMTPDIIFNPHGFPSRMTIGMMVESMAGKSAALHGLVHDATPFQFSEENTAIDYFGRCLEAAGYNYYGNETLYSGTSGRELEAKIFFGVVYYQRLRHMVADKFQVRSTGPIDNLTHQPVKGRKRGGGIRFGEMERDSLLAHGTSFLLQDRLFNCSDRSLTYICTKCGGLLSTVFGLCDDRYGGTGIRKWTCNVCKTREHIELIALPFVFRYLAAELASVNIRVVLGIK